MAQRLRYSLSGFERAVMMARAAVVAVVEGIDDNLFYDVLLSQYAQEHNREFTVQIRTPKEVSAGADGKSALIKIFRHFRVRRRLKSSSGSKRLIFFADLDYDGISRKKLRNPHLIYSPGVSFENSLYDIGSVVDGIESIVSRKIDRINFLPFTNFFEWKKMCAQRWRDWLIYCVACEISAVAPRKNRSGVSSIHVNYPPVLKEGEPERVYANFCAAVRSGELAARYWERATAIVERAIENNVDGIFCGKWYPHFLKGEVALLGGAYATLASRVNQGRYLVSHLLRGIRFKGGVKNYYFSHLDRAFAA